MKTTVIILLILLVIAFIAFRIYKHRKYNKVPKFYDIPTEYGELDFNYYVRKNK